MDPGLKPAGPRYARTGITKNGDRRASLAMTEDERRHPEAKPKDLFFKEGISTFTKLLIFSSSYLLSRIGCS
jgi:hypothetical protein